MTRHFLKGILDEIWDKALEEVTCSCGSDDHWEQTIRGAIRCAGCNQTIVS